MLLRKKHIRGTNRPSHSLMYGLRGIVSDVSDLNFFHTAVSSSRQMTGLRVTIIMPAHGINYRLRAFMIMINYITTKDCSFDYDTNCDWWNKIWRRILSGQVQLFDIVFLSHIVSQLLSMMNNIKFVLSFFVVVALLASLALRLYLTVLKSESDRRNATIPLDYFTEIFPMPSKKAMENVLGDGSGDYYDGPPPDFRPGRRWSFFRSETLDPLFFYDLEWDKPEKILIFPKQWYEDEELALAWNTIVAKQKKVRSVSLIKQFAVFGEYIFVRVYLKCFVVVVFFHPFRTTPAQIVDVAEHVTARPLFPQ